MARGPRARWPGWPGGPGPRSTRKAAMNKHRQGEVDQKVERVAKLARDGDAIAIGESYVDKHERGTLRERQLQTALPIACTLHAVAGRAEDALHRGAHVRVVLDKEDVVGVSIGIGHARRNMTGRWR